MLRRVVVVVPHLQFETQCTICNRTGSVLPLCEHCHRIKELPTHLNYFEILGVAPHWILDESTLRDQFIKVSALVHPDRHVARGKPDSEFALRWTTVLNRANQTLRDPEDCLAYFLSLHGHDVSRFKNQEPLDLASEYFEAQDDPQGQLLEFRHKVESELDKCRDLEKNLSQQWNSEVEKRVLSQLANNWIRSRYLKSMLSDMNQRFEKAK